MDGFGYSYRWGRITASYRLAQLDRTTTTEENETLFENRFFAAHRLDIDLSRNLRIGFFETVLFGGAGRQVDLFYLNPLIFYHGTQLNEQVNDNTTIGFDFSYNLAVGYRFYGQLLVDDIQVDNESQGDQEPDQIGLIAGCYLADLIPEFDIKLEYSRVNNWTFNQMLPRNRYLHHHHPIGGHRGNDYDEMGLTILRWLGENLNASALLGYSRQGEGSIDAEWTSPWTQIEGDYSEPFPTGVVEKTLTAALGVKGFVTPFAYVDIFGGINKVTSFGHVDGNDETLPFIKVTLSGFLSTILDLDR